MQWWQVIVCDGRCAGARGHGRLQLRTQVGDLPRKHGCCSCAAVTDALALALGCGGTCEVGEDEAGTYDDDSGAVFALRTLLGGDTVPIIPKRQQIKTVSESNLKERKKEAQSESPVPFPLPLLLPGM